MNTPTNCPVCSHLINYNLYETRMFCPATDHNFYFKPSYSPEINLCKITEYLIDFTLPESNRFYRIFSSENFYKENSSFTSFHSYYYSNNINNTTLFFTLDLFFPMPNSPTQLNNLIQRLNKISPLL